jgi:hypothetical protein
MTLTRLREFVRPWLLASLVWCVVFFVVIRVAIWAVAGSLALEAETTKSTLRAELWMFVESNPMIFVVPAYILASLAAAPRFILSTARGAGLGPDGLGRIVRAWPQAGRAYAGAPLPVMLSSYAILAIAEPLGPQWWFVLMWSFYGSLNTILSTLLIAAIGAAVIRASATVVGE